MPEINGVWLNPIPRTQKEIAAIQKKSKCYFFAHRAISICMYVNQKLLIGASFLSCIAYGMQRETQPIVVSLDQRSVLLLRYSNSTSEQIMTLLGEGDTEISYFASLLKCRAIEISSFGVCMGVLTNMRLGELNNIFFNKYKDCISIVEASKKLQVPAYEDMQCYDQVINIDKTNVGPISCTSVEKIEQKVFYRGEVYEYYYLLTAYVTNPEGRDHTGQPYDISLFYRIDDNNIQYID
jgi:hypothetical protein